ncbi:MAG: hypothetical protein AAF604_03025 [Acidobacteriota bacterium]
MSTSFRRCAPVLVVLFALIAPACDVDRRGTAWRQSVEPTTICPGDPVTVTWDAGPEDGCERNEDGVFMGSGCGDPTRVVITATPDVFASDPINERETRGTRVVNPTEDTTIDFSAFDTDDALFPFDRTIEVITDEVPGQGTFQGACCGRRPCWSDLQQTSSGDLPETLEPSEICNNNRFAIRLTVEQSDGTRSTFGLEPEGSGANCTPPLSGVTRVTGEADDPAITGGADCSPTVSNPPGSFVVDVVWRCPA